MCLTVLSVHQKLITMGPIHEIMANFSVFGPKILFYVENVRRDWVPLPIVIFYYGDRVGKLCLTVDKKLITMGPIHGIHVTGYLLIPFKYQKKKSERFSESSSQRCIYNNFTPTWHPTPTDTSVFCAGKLKASNGGIFVPWGGLEHYSTYYEVLVNPAAAAAASAAAGTRVEFAPASGGFVPAGAVAGGCSARGDTLYVGQTSSPHRGNVIPGKVHHGQLFYGYMGKEYSSSHYNVLVAR